MNTPPKRSRLRKLMGMSVGMSIISSQVAAGFSNKNVGGGTFSPVSCAGRISNKKNHPNLLTTFTSTSTSTSTSLHAIENPKKKFRIFNTRKNKGTTDTRTSARTSTSATTVNPLKLNYKLQQKQLHANKKDSRPSPRHHFVKDSMDRFGGDLSTRASEDMIILEEMMNNMTAFEMAVMSTAAIAIPAGVVVTLAMNAESSASLNEQTSNFVRDILSLSSFGSESADDVVNLVASEGLDLIEDSFEELGSISFNVFDAAVPTTATDVISIALGEGIAAGIGGFVTAVAGIGLKTKGFFQNRTGFLRFGKRSNQNDAQSDATVDGFIAGAVADTDYFITRAGLSALGVPSFIGVIFAAVPSQIIKLSARQREQRLKEDEFMQSILSEQKEKTKNLSTFRLVRKKEKETNIETIAEVPKMTPGIANQVDFVEIFSDVTKWLEYDVLIENFAGGMVTWNGVPVSSGLESAVFGFLAALSSQLWADVIYLNSDYGLKDNRDAARSRSVMDTLTLYFLKCLSAATLFGVYESVRLPISNFITNLLSGGVESCAGSQDYNLCLETFMIDNSAEATAEASGRAFFVAAIDIIQRLNDFGTLNADNIPELIRSLFVQFNSVFA